MAIESNSRSCIIERLGIWGVYGGGSCSEDLIPRHIWFVGICMGGAKAQVFDCLFAVACIPPDRAMAIFVAAVFRSRLFRLRPEYVS